MFEYWILSLYQFSVFLYHYLFCLFVHACVRVYVCMGAHMSSCVCVCVCMHRYVHECSSEKDVFFPPIYHEFQGCNWGHQAVYKLSHLPGPTGNRRDLKCHNESKTYDQARWFLQIHKGYKHKLKYEVSDYRGGSVVKDGDCFWRGWV